MTLLILSTHLPLDIEHKQLLLAESDHLERSKLFVKLLSMEKQWSKIYRDINNEVKSQIRQEQESYFVQKKLRSIKDRLVGESDQEDDINLDDSSQYIEKLEALDIREDHRKNII